MGARWWSLLELAESQGLNPDVSCRGGSCGTCRTKLISGQVHYLNLTAEMPAEGEVLICCAVPAQAKEGDAPLVLDLYVGVIGAYPAIRGFSTSSMPPSLSS